MVWTNLQYDLITGDAIIDASTNPADFYNPGNLGMAVTTDRRIGALVITSNYTLGTYNAVEDILLVDATNGNVTITIPGNGSTITWYNPFTIKRVDATTNTVTVQTSVWGFDTGGNTDTIPPLGAKTYIVSNGLSGSSQLWRAISSVGTVSGLITSASANALSVGANGSTNPVLNVDASASSVATGIDVVGAAAGSGVELKAISSGTNEALSIDAKGSGALNLNATATGAVVVGHGLDVIGATALTGTETITSASANAFTVGANGGTNPVFNINASASSVANGVTIVGTAAGSGVEIKASSSGTNENLGMDAKGSGTINLGGNSTGGVSLGAGGGVNIVNSGGVRLDTGTKTASATAGAATLNKMAGVVTSESITTAAGSDYTLTLTNSDIAAADQVFASVQLGSATTGEPCVTSVTPASGSAVIKVRNVAASAAFNGTIVVSFMVLKN